jgi:hypothetical protein
LTYFKRISAIFKDDLSQDSVTGIIRSDSGPYRTDYRAQFAEGKFLYTATGVENAPDSGRAYLVVAESKPAIAVCWEEDMIADVSMRMPAEIRHNIAQFCQAAGATRKDLMLRSERASRSMGHK